MIGKEYGPLKQLEELVINLASDPSETDNLECQVDQNDVGRSAYIIFNSAGDKNTILLWLNNVPTSHIYAHCVGPPCQLHCVSQKFDKVAIWKSSAHRITSRIAQYNANCAYDSGESIIY